MLNKVLLIGELAMAPEVIRTRSYTRCKLDLAVAGLDTDPAHPERLDVLVQGRAAEVCGRVHKGRLVSVEGKLCSHEYTAPDGRVVRSAVVVADTVLLLDAPKEADLESFPASEIPHDMYGNMW